MSPQAQQIAIAEAYGWINQGRTKSVPALEHKWTHPSLTRGTFLHTSALPSYLTDLNAMHEMEQTLTEQQQATYALFLHGVSKRPKVDHLGRDFDAIHATASQKAEALLRTLNLWDPTK